MVDVTETFFFDITFYRQIIQDVQFDSVSSNYFPFCHFRIFSTQQQLTKNFLGVRNVPRVYV